MAPPSAGAAGVAVADGETRTSRIVGSVDYAFPVAPPLCLSEEEEAELLTIVSGVQNSMPYTIQLAASCGLQAHEIVQIALEVFHEVDQTLNTWNPDSEISRINNNATLPAGQDHEMSPMLQTVVEAAKELCKATRGAFDPAIGPLLEFYHERAKQSASTRKKSKRLSLYEPDSSEEETYDANALRRTKEAIRAFQNVLSIGFSSDPSGESRISKTAKHLLEISTWSAAFSVQGNILQKKHPDAKMELSGIAKGFTVDEIVRRLSQRIQSSAETDSSSSSSSSSSSCYVDWGGDIKVCGNHPAGRPWQVAVLQPPTLLELQTKVDLALEQGQTGPVLTLSSMEEEDNKQYLAILELHDGDAVATSGDAEQVIQRDGKLYSRIVNPQFGRMLEINDTTCAQAVIVCSSCMVADALATAAISMEDPARARAMLDPLRTGFHVPLKDFLLYARNGPRIIRLNVPGSEHKEIRDKRMACHDPAKVIVVGSGLAGMSAAIEAADANANVILLEKEEKTGGNSAKATSGINGWGTTTQAQQHVADEERLFERDTHRSGKGGITNPGLVRTLSTQSANAVHWLQNRFGIPLTVLSQLGGHCTKRTHRAPPDEQGQPVPIGWKIMSTIRSVIESQYQGKIEIRCGSKVTKLIHNIDEEGVKTVTGVVIERSDGSTYEELADSIILATGGFGCSAQSPNGLMARFRSDLVGTPTTNGGFAQGDGILLGEELGVQLIDMDKVQLHPTAFIDPKDPSNNTKILGPEMLRGSGGILVNSYGKRFVNELDLRSVVAKAMQDNCSPYKSDTYEGPPFAWCIMSKEAQNMFGLPLLNFYKDKMGLFEDCADIASVASVIGCDWQTLMDTVQAYTHAKADGSCPLTNKVVFPADLTIESKDLIVARVTPAIHYTMGGIRINSAGEVREQLVGHFGGSRHIRGLYAAGEVTGGVHGGNRLGGNSLLECCVFGRIAGERAATVKQHSPVMFPNVGEGKTETDWVPLVLRTVKITDQRYGMNTMEVRFNLYGSLQHSGLDIGQFIGLRGAFDGETLLGYFSPITRPEDEGMLALLCRLDDRGGPISKVLNYIRPGSVLHMCGMGGLRLKFTDNGIFFRDKQIKRIGLLAGGTGIAPMVQIMRAYTDQVRKHGAKIAPNGLHLVYAAEEQSDLAFVALLEKIQASYPDHFRYYLKLNRPPLGWTEGVGFVDTKDVKMHLFYPPAEGDLFVMCGPPVFESAMIKTLQRLGFDSSQWFSYAEGDRVSAHV